MPRNGNDASVRALALVGPTGAGKTALFEAMLLATGAVERRPDGSAADQVGDASPEARARGRSVDLNIASFDFLGDRYTLIDCPGSTELAAETDGVLAAVDAAVVVVDPEPGKALLLQPVLRALELAGTPHVLFVNKLDQARGSLEDLLKALAPVSTAPLVARQIPITEGERVTGFVDLALERAFIYRPGAPSQQTPLTPELELLEADARAHMLEQLADFDDELLEQLLSDVVPSREAVFADLARELQEGLIVPVLFGSAQNGQGVRRLLKALRHETAPSARAAQRLGLEGPGACVIKTAYSGQAGKLAYVRVFHENLVDGASLTLPGGARRRAGGLFAVQGVELKKIPQARPGDIAAIGKLDEAIVGDLLCLDETPRSLKTPLPSRPSLYAIAVEAGSRKDDVRLSGALAKLVDEDRGLSMVQDAERRQVLLCGQGEEHLRLALDRLKRRYGVEVLTERPKIPYRETIQKSSRQHSRHKKQTGGHGQFADVTVEIKPLARGSGVRFSQRISGGAVPRQWLPAVEQGVRDGLARGPLGYPVTDVEVTLVDGAHHSVDSSEMAFRAAGRLAMEEGLRSCGSVLLEPVDKVAVLAPSTALSNVNSALAARRGQILGFAPREGWPGWERIEAYLPQNERHDLIAEVRALTQGQGAFEAAFDHMSELSGRLASDALSARSAA